MVIVSDPDIIDVYSLAHIYSKNEVRYYRRLPLYGYQIPAVSDIEFSDVNDLFFVSAVDPAANKSIILAYRPNSPSATSLFTTVPLDKLYSRPGL